MSSAPLVILLPGGERADYVPGSGLVGRAQCVTATGIVYDVQIPEALAATWAWHGGVLVRVSGEALPTWAWPPPQCFQRARRLEAAYSEATDHPVPHQPQRRRKAA